MSNKVNELLNKKEEIYKRIADKLELKVASLNGGANMLINDGNIVMSEKVLQLKTLPSHEDGMKMLMNKNNSIHIRDFAERLKKY